MLACWCNERCVILFLSLVEINLLFCCTVLLCAIVALLDAHLMHFGASFTESCQNTASPWLLHPPARSTTNTSLGIVRHITASVHHKSHCHQLTPLPACCPSIPASASVVPSPHFIHTPPRQTGRRSRSKGRRERSPLSAERTVQLESELEALRARLAEAEAREVEAHMAVIR